MSCECENCKHVANQRRTALRGLMTPGSGPAIAEVWNATLEAFPCLLAKNSTMIIEIHDEGAIVCTTEGEAPSGEMLADLLDCCASGDCEDACRYVLSEYQPEFRIVRCVDKTCNPWKFENGIATAEEKQATCEAIYFESESDFSDEDLAEVYLIWQAADDAQNAEE